MARFNYRAWLGLVLIAFFQINGLSQDNLNNVYSCINCDIEEYHPLGDYKVTTDRESFKGLTLFDKQNQAIDQLDFFLVDQMLILNDSTLLTVAPLYGAEIVVRNNKFVIKRYTALTEEASNSIKFNQFMLYNNALIGSKFLPKRKGYEFYKAVKMTPIPTDKLMELANIPNNLVANIEKAFIVELDDFERIDIDYSSDKVMKGNIFFAGASDQMLMLYHYPTGYLYQFDSSMNVTSSLKMPVQNKKDYPYFIYDYKEKNPYFLKEQVIGKKIVYELYSVDFDQQSFNQRKIIEGNIVGVSDGYLYLTNKMKKENFVYSIAIDKELPSTMPTQTIKPLEIKEKKK